MATPPLDPAVQAQIDALKAEVAKLRSGGTNSYGSKSGLDIATDFISNDKISSKITSALNFLPESVTSNPAFKASVGKITEAASLVGAIADQAVQSADSVFNMYQSGVVIGMDQLSITANNFGVKIEDLTKLLTRHGRVVSAMGIDATAQLGRQFLALTHNGADLGMSIDEANESALAYAEIVNNSGRMQKFDSTLLAEGAMRFSKALNEAAQASGRNVEQIRAETVTRLGRADAFAIQQSMSDQEQIIFQDNMAQMGAFNSALNNTGDQLQDWMVQFASTGNISGLQDRNFTRALAAIPGGTELFTKAMNQTGQEQKDTLAQLGGMFKQYVGQHTELLASRNPETQAMMKVMGDFGRDVNATTAKAGVAVDTTAAGIEGTVADFQKAGNAINNAINDLAVSGFKSFDTKLTEAADAATTFATKIGDAARYAEQNPVSADTAVTMGIGTVGLGAIIGNYLNPLIGSFGGGGRPDGGGGAGRGGAAALAEEEAAAAARTVKVNRFSLLKSLGLGWLVDQGGQIAAGSGYTRTGAGMQAGGEIYMSKIGGEIVGGIVGAFGKNPEAGAKIGGAIAAGIATYLNLDNIKTAIFGPTPVANDIATTPTDSTSENANNIDRIEAVVNNSQTDRELVQQQNMFMNSKLDLMIKQLTLLNTNIEDQTTALKNAFERGGNNVYP